MMTVGPTDTLNSWSNTRAADWTTNHISHHARSSFFHVTVSCLYLFWPVLCINPSHLNTQTQVTNYRLKCKTFQPNCTNEKFYFTHSSARWFHFCYTFINTAWWIQIFFANIFRSVKSDAKHLSGRVSQCACSSWISNCGFTSIGINTSLIPQWETVCSPFMFTGWQSIPLFFIRYRMVCSWFMISFFCSWATDFTLQTNNNSKLFNFCMPV